MKRVGLIIFSFCCLSCVLSAQLFEDFPPKVFNWGGKIGFNSALPVINSFSVDGVTMDNVETKHEVGFMASLFCRVNVERFFIQPGVSIHFTKSEFSFSAPKSSDLNNNFSFSTPTQEGFELTTHSIDVPVLIGYNIVKEGPYVLSVMAGPKAKYNYRVSYTPQWEENRHEYVNDNTPYGVSILTAVSVTVWPLFFDFSYEFGLNEVQSDFTQKGTNTPDMNKIILDKRTNILSFSLGFLF